METLLKISNARDSETLKTKVAFERSKGRITRSDLEQAYTELRLPQSLIHRDMITEDDLAAAVSKRLEEVTHPERRKVLKEAITTLAEHKNSDMMRLLLATSEDIEDPAVSGVLSDTMDVEKAYKVLEIEKGIDDETALMVYEVRVSLLKNFSAPVEACDPSDNSYFRSPMRTTMLRRARCAWRFRPLHRSARATASKQLCKQIRLPIVRRLFTPSR